MAMYRESFGDIFLDLLPNLEDVTYMYYDEWPLAYPGLYKVMDTDKPFINFTGVGPLGLPVEFEAGNSIHFDDLTELYDKKFTARFFGLGVEYHRSTIDDDKFGIFNDSAAALAKAFRLGDEIIAAEIMDNSTSTSQTRYTSADGAAIHSASHLLADGVSTWTNVLSGNADMAIASVQSAMLVLEDTPDDENNPMMIVGDQLIYPSALRFTARKLLESVDHPETADRSTNPLGGDNITGFRWPYLTDTDAWAVASQRTLAQKPSWLWVRRQALDIDADVDIKTQMAFEVGTDRKDYGVFEPRGTVYSAGGGS